MITMLFLNLKAHLMTKENVRIHLQRQKLHDFRILFDTELLS